MSTMSERIRKVRKKNNLNQTQFGEKLGVTRSVINNIELNRNKNGIPDNIIKLIAMTFDVNEEWLRTGEGEVFKQNLPFSLDKFLQEQEATELEIDIMKLYFSLDKNVRKNLINSLKNVFSNNLEFVNDNTQYKVNKKELKTDSSSTIKPNINEDDELPTEYANMSDIELLRQANMLEAMIEKRRASSILQEQSEDCWKKA